MNLDHHLNRMSDDQEPLPPVVLHLTPHEVMRALEALRHGRGYVAERVADKLEEAAPAHMATLRDTP